jgi:glycosyltransferase involved in cell wall biosynthesis
VKLIANVWLISKLIDQLRPDAVYTNTSAVAAGAIAAKLRHVPHVWHIHENIETFQLRFVVPTPFMRRLVTALSERVIFVTELALRSLYPDGHDKAVVIHNGVDTAAFRVPSGAAAGTRQPRDGGDRGRIAFFGALLHRKGVDVLMRAVAVVKTTYPNVRLDVWGQGHDDYVRYLEELSMSLGTNQQVTFKGYCEDVYSGIAAYDLVVVPSRAESFSLVALEAMAAGVPVIVTRCGGPEEFIANGTDGYVTPVDDHEELARAIEKLFESPARANEMARRAREKVDRDFRLSTKLEAILTQVAAVGSKTS